MGKGRSPVGPHPSTDKVPYKTADYVSGVGIV
jgi:hypothetical protein